MSGNENKVGKIMKTKRYRGESVHSLMRQVREELGDDVLLLSTTQKAQDSVEIEIGLLVEQGAGSSTTDDSSDTDPDEYSLEDFADLYRDDDTLGALPLHAVRSEVITVIRKACRAKKWTQETLTRALGKVLAFNPYIGEESRFLAIMGPRRSGRTTAIIKLTTNLQHALGLKLGIVAGDPEDEAGAYHLCVMGKMLGVPVVGLNEALPSKKRLDDAAKRLGECDLIFVDTPHLDGLGVRGRRELLKILDGAKGVERFLMTPANQTEEALRELVTLGSEMGCTRLVPSFTDKAGKIGALINVAYDSRLPLAFVSRGDRIPEDIEPASPSRFAWLLGRLVQ